ncbi:aminodeoxychorismate lyase [Sporosarcina sp. HYO08]|uniref:aminodeoxychorismate lyase n=1 Tax=Sporosarcina sp. HYO08 TaxID=1759557 RepID=UPI0020A26042|nr:aminodeoxychorismate lyase [Sporosarcina sp. HYO08]
MNGEYLKAEHLTISPFDHGFLYGIGFFETFRTYDGHVLLLDKHLERLKFALSEFNISLPYEADDFFQAIRTLNERAGGTDGYFRLNVSGGVHDIGLAPTVYAEPNVILFRKELGPTVRGAEKKAVWLKTFRNRPESAVRHKSHNFLNNVRGRLELPSLKEWEGLFLTAEGHVAEGVTSNVFWLKDDVLYTPTIGTGILPGTTRTLVLTLAKEMGIECQEGYFTKEAVEHADELFVTNAIQELVPMKSIEDISLPGAAGVYYQKLHRLYVEKIHELKDGGQ